MIRLFGTAVGPAMLMTACGLIALAGSLWLGPLGGYVLGPGRPRPDA